MSFKKNPLKMIVTVLALGMAVYHLLHTQFMMLGPVEHQNLHYALALVVVFLSLIQKTESTFQKAILWILIALSIAGTSYIFFHFNDLMEIRGPLYRLTNMDIIIGFILILVGLEGSRRTFGMVFPIVALSFMAYAYFGHYLSGTLASPAISLRELLTVYCMGLQGGIYGTALGISANYIFLFVLFGGLLGVTGAGRFFTKVGSMAARRMAGGPAITSVVSSGLMGSVTGSAMANVATTGAFTIPLMKKVGYQPHQAGAIEAAASTGGQIMPPVMGATAFIMAEMLEVPYVRVMTAALIPAILYFFSVGLYAQLQAKKMRVDASDSMESVSIRELLSDAPIFILPLATIVMLLIMRYSPMFTIFWTIVLLLLLSLAQGGIRREKNTIKQLMDGFVKGAVGGANIAVTCAILGPIISSVTKTVLGMKIAGVIALWCGGSLILALIITMFACMILGMGAPTLAAYVLVSLVGAPVLVNMGVAPLSAHMFVFIFAVFACLTPPIAVSAIPAAGIAKSNYMKTALESSKAGIIGFLVPYMVVFAPELMLGDVSAFQIVLSVIASLFAILSLTAAVVGYGFERLHIAERVIIFLIAATLFGYVATKTTGFLLVGLGSFAVFGYLNKRKRVEQRGPAIENS